MARRPDACLRTTSDQYEVLFEVVHDDLPGTGGHTYQGNSRVNRSVLLAFVGPSSIMSAEEHTDFRGEVCSADIDER